MKFFDKAHRHIRNGLITAGVCAAVALIAFAVVKALPYSIDAAASMTGRRIEKRMSELDRYIAEASRTDERSLLRFDSFPKDFVIYRYVNDSLQSWCNQFSESNDDISRRLIFPRLTSNPNRLQSPLLRITQTPSYINMGPKWYLVKMVPAGRDVKIIAGIEVKNTLIEKHVSGSNGINPKLHIKSKFDITPLMEDSGAMVKIDGTPVFKIIMNKDWGLKFGFNSILFSPIIYADGPVFTSLGALILVNISLIVLMSILVILRRKIIWKIYSNQRTARRNLIIYSIAIVILIAFSITYTSLSLKSLYHNSDISLEFFRWANRTGYSITVFASYILLMMLTWFQTYSLIPLIRDLTKIDFNPLSTGCLIAFSFITAAFLTATSSSNGFKKEQERVWSWANRLAIDRDISLELQLISIEDAIASDQVIKTLIQLDNSDRIIFNRIADNYLGRISQTQDINILIIKDDDRRGQVLLETILSVSIPVSDGSRFLYNDAADGQNGYFGIFTYPAEKGKISRLIVRIPINSDTDRYGYRSLLNAGSRPGELSIPAFYSYGKYSDRKLKTYHSGYNPYPYPTIYSQFGSKDFDRQGHLVTKSSGYTHFVSMTSENDIVVISRPSRKFTTYFTSFSVIFLSLFLVSILFRRDLRTERKAHRSQLKTKIHLLIVVALVLTMTAIVVVSVIFVYDRTEINLRSLMTSKINTMQALVEKRCQYAESYHDLMSTGFTNALNEVGMVTKTDISLFTPSGEVFTSTDPDVFDKMIVGSRLDQDAFYSITRLNQRYFIHSEKFAGRRYYSLYAPIFNNSGQMIAIACCPYTDRNFDFNQEAVLHASLITCLFFMLLLLSIYISSFVMDSILQNLTKLSNKMDSVDIHNLQKIDYNGNDEISSLVKAFNKMVDVLSASSRQLAKAERDNAWSEMARQAAHEIKNSLTPIKLKIQKLIRLKHSGNENWDEQFEENAKVILEHIDILAETASGFSAIAKLSTEEPTSVNLDKILHEQILIFDNKDNISFTYMGLEDSYVLAPQSQLIRVFINLITNAIQAIEIRQKTDSSAGEGSDEKGTILVCLRKSVKDGFYDVVVEDNGTGVKPEDIAKLFQPNFTTKTSGTGLGLSICRSIIESCDGTISYSRSYALGGACFTVTLPAISKS